MEIGSDSFMLSFRQSWHRGDADPTTYFTSNGDRYDMTPKLDARMIWDEPVTESIGKTARPFKDGSTRIFHFGTLDQAFQSSATGRKALERIESDQPQSFLPQL